MTQNDFDFIASALSAKRDSLLREIAENDAYRKAAEEKAAKEKAKAEKQASTKTKKGETN